MHNIISYLSNYDSDLIITKTKWFNGNMNCPLTFIELKANNGYSKIIINCELIENQFSTSTFVNSDDSLSGVYKVKMQSIVNYDDGIVDFNIKFRTSFRELFKIGNKVVCTSRSKKFNNYISKGEPFLVMQELAADSGKFRPFYSLINQRVECKAILDLSSFEKQFESVLNSLVYLMNFSDQE